MASGQGLTRGPEDFVAFRREEFEKPRFRVGVEVPICLTPGELDVGGVEGVVGKEELAPIVVGELVADKTEVEPLVGAVDLVADDGVAGMSKVDADLVFAAGAGSDLQEREVGVLAGEAAKDLEVGAGRPAGGGDAVLDGDAAGGVGSERGFDGAGIVAGVSINDGEVLFEDLASFPEVGEFGGGLAEFGDEDQAAGLTVQAVDRSDAGRNCRPRADR